MKFCSVAYANIFVVLTPREVIGAIAVGVVLLATGCGGSDDNASQSRTNPTAETPPPALRSSDRAAFSELSRGSGVLRAAAVPVAYGSATRIVVADRLDAATAALRKTRPRSGELRRLRKRTLAALRLASSPAALRDGSAKQIARDSIAEADRIDAGLRHYAASNPAANDLVPGSSG